MKALEKIKEMIDFCDAVGCHRAIYESIKFVGAELEALQQSKSCEGCKGLVEIGKSYKHCEELAINISHMDWGNFCCNRYEPKEK